MKRIRVTARQAQQLRVNKKRLANNEAEAHIEATRLYEEQKTIPNGMSARAVVDQVNEHFGSNISKRTVQYYVQVGKAGMAPSKRGPTPGRLSEPTFELVLSAFETFVQINQANGEAATHNKRARLILRLNKTISVSSYATEGIRFFGN